MARSSRESIPEPSGPSQLQRHLARSVRKLASAFKAAGWEVSHPPGRSDAPDLLLRRGERAYVVDLKASVGRARRPHLRALLADALLRSRVHAEDLGVRPLAVLSAPSLSEASIADLADYAKRFAAGAPWGVLDERGRFDLHGPGLEDVLPPRVESVAELEPDSPRPVSRAPHNLFSDLGQWMLKVLIARRVPEHWLSAPRQSFQGVAAFAKQAGVSLASASLFLSALDAAGHIVQVGGAFRLLRPEALLEAWRIASSHSAEERYARFLLPASDPAQRLRQVLGAPVRKRGGRAAATRDGVPSHRVCLALFSACLELDVRVVRGAPVHLYAEDLSNSFLKEFQLHPVDHASEADLIVRRPRFPESVFRGSVRVQNVPVADVLQCWLDVSFHPARGEEQAAEIARQLNMSEWSR